MRNHTKRATWSVILTVVGVVAIAAAIAASAGAKAQKAHAAAARHDQYGRRAPPRSRWIPAWTTRPRARRSTGWSTPASRPTHARPALASTELIPGLATALPKISNGGKTYTVTLRKGLKFSNGDPLVGERLHVHTSSARSAIPWGGASTFITPVHRRRGGVREHRQGQDDLRHQTNNATGKIVIHLTAAYGPFDNVLAFPALGIVDPKGRRSSRCSRPPAGRRRSVHGHEHRPNASFDVVQNPYWTSRSRASRRATTTST